MRQRSLFSATVLAVLVGVAAPAEAQPPSTVELVRGPFSTTSVSPEAAREAILTHVKGAPAIELAYTRMARMRGGEAVVRFAQTHKGLPVASRGATVTFDAQGAVRQIASRLERDLPDNVSPGKTRAEVAALVEAQTGLPTTEDRAVLSIWPGPEGNQLAWAVYPQPIVGIPQAPVHIVDAKTGELIVRFDALRDLNQAAVYPTNPIKSPDLIPVTLTPKGVTLDNAFIKSLNCIDLKTVKQAFGVDIHTCDLLQTAAPDANGDFLDAPADDKEAEDVFSEITMFYHATRAYQMFRGYEPGFTIQASALNTISNLRLPKGYYTFDTSTMGDPEIPLEPFQNAFYAPGDPLFQQAFGLNGAALWFGQGPNRDYSYDGDVVYHELTHAVVDATLKLIGTPHFDAYGVSYAPGGMNEGLADYFSSALTGDPDVGEYAAEDFAPGIPYIRSLANGDACPTAIGGETHQDATLFSGALWDVRESLSQADAEKLDEAIFSAMNASPTGDLAYEDFAEIILTEVESGLSANIASSLKDAFTARGVLPKCTRILEWQGTQLDGPKDLYSLWWAPGMSATGIKNLGYTPGVVMFHAALPQYTAKVSFQVNKSSLVGGGNGTPFTPKFLVKFGPTPMQFKYKPFEVEPDLLVLDGVKSGAKYDLTVDVPEGIVDVYVMIASAGNDDGGYNHFLLTTEAGSPPPDDPPPDDPPPAKNNTSSDTTESEGCGCRLAGEPTEAAHPTALLAGAAALLTLGARRRSQRPRRVRK